MSKLSKGGPHRKVLSGTQIKNPFKINRQSDVELAPDQSMEEINKGYSDNISYAKNLLDQGKLSKDQYDGFVEEEKAMLRDWRVRKAKDAGKRKT